MNGVDERPHLGSNFRVEIDEGNGRVVEIGCAEVIFPDLPALPDLRLPGAREHLVLRRAAGTDTTLRAWWGKAAAGRAPKRRSVRITLLDADHATPVLRWRFREARPVSLRHSPLNAMANAVVLEAIELAFDAVEID